MAMLFFVAGCQDEEVHLVADEEPDATAENVGARVFSLTASMPEGSGGTRVAFTQDGKNVSLTWEEGDQLDLLFVQGGTMVKQSLVQVSNISADGKKAGFSINLPPEIQDGTFDLYGVYGGLGLSDSNPSLALLPKTDGSAPSLASMAEGKHFMLVFSQTGLSTTSPQASVTFRHVGSLFCLTLKNASGTPLENLGSAMLSSFVTGWAYNSGSEQMYYSVTDDQLQGNSGGDHIMLYGDGATIGTNDTINFWGWYPPLPGVNWPELTLTLYDKNNTLLGESSTDKPARTSPTLPGKCYHLYAVCNDASFHYTDHTYTAPLQMEDLTIEGDLRHAEGADNFIAMVYTRSGVVYYNQAQRNGEWSGEIALGAGSDPRIAIDADNNPHVVYVSEGKIVYLTSDGEGPTPPVFIESNYGGSCSLPDIAVDGSGYAHITYSDTKGGSYSDTYVEIMYANNSSGSFVKNMIYDGDYYYSSGYGQGTYYEKGSRIAVDGTGQYFILSFQRYFDRTMGGSNYTSLSIQFKSQDKSGSVSSGNDIYDIGFDGSNVVAFYKTGNVITTSELTVSGATIGFANPQTVTTALSNTYANPATLLALPGVRVLGGISSTGLFVKYGTEADELLGDAVKSGTVAVVAQSGVDTYVAFTGSDGIIKLAKRE